MPTIDEAIEVEVDGDRIAGTLVRPAPGPGVLFVHGWGGSRAQYTARARGLVAATGCTCLSIDLRGHAALAAQRETVSRGQNLDDLVAAYDTLVSRPAVDPDAIAVAGSSYGGYLAALLSVLRPVRWMVLRVPALYRDEDWAMPKQRLDRARIDAYRLRPIRPEENRALAACAGFRGDALIVRSEFDRIVPEQVIDNYRAAFGQARSLTYRVLEGADHGLTDIRSQQAFTALLVEWLAQRFEQAEAERPGATLDADPHAGLAAETPAVSSLGVPLDAPVGADARAR